MGEPALSTVAAGKPTTWFWSTGAAWGTVRQRPTRKGIEVELTVLHGSLDVHNLALTGFGSAECARPKTLTTGQMVTLSVERDE